MSLPEAPPPPADAGGGVDPVMVAVLNLLIAGGAGYFLIGQKWKGVLAAALWLVLMCPTWTIGSALISIFAAVDGYRQALKLLEGRTIGP